MGERIVVVKRETRLEPATYFLGSGAACYERGRARASETATVMES